MFETIQNSYKNLSFALGFFDGVHLAHQKVILNAVNYAKENHIKSAVLTFNNHPAEAAGREIKYITTQKERNRLIKDLGIDYIFSIDFDKNLMNVTREEYLKSLVLKFAPKAITTGFNHTFGKSRLGNDKYLKEQSNLYGYKYFMLEPEKINMVYRLTITAIAAVFLVLTFIFVSLWKKEPERTDATATYVHA